MEEADLRKFKARVRKKQEHDEDSDDYPPTDDVDEDRYFPDEHKMTSPKPWPLHREIKSRLRNPKYKPPIPRKRESSPVLPNEDLTPSESSPPAAYHNPQIARETVPDHLWRRGSSIDKGKAANDQDKRRPTSPSLPEDGQSDSNTSGDDSHPDDYHRKKRREAKSRPAPPSSSFREVPKKKKKKSPSPPPESDDEQQDYSMFYNMYPPPMSPSNQTSGFFDDGSDDEELPELPVGKSNTTPKATQEQLTHVDSTGQNFSSPVSPASNNHGSDSTTSMPEQPSGDKESSDTTVSPVRDKSKNHKRKKKKHREHKKYYKPPLPLSDSSDAGDTDVASQQQKQSQSQSQANDFDSDRLPGDSMLPKRNYVLPPPLSEAYRNRRPSSPGSSHIQKVTEHREKKRRSRSKSRLNQHTTFESSQESTQRSNRDKSISKVPFDCAQPHESFQWQSQPLPEADLSQTTQGSYWEDSIYSKASRNSRQASQAANAQEARSASHRSRSLSKHSEKETEKLPQAPVENTAPAGHDYEEMELDELEDDSQGGSDGDDEHDPEEASQLKQVTDKVSPELEETPPSSRRLTSRNSAAPSTVASASSVPARKLATFRSQSVSTGLDPDSQLERALYTADEVAESVLEQETFKPISSISTASTDRDSLLDTRQSAPTSRATSTQRSRNTEQQKPNRPSSIGQDQRLDEDSDIELVRRPPANTVRQSSDSTTGRPRGSRERVSTASVSASNVKNIIEISSGEEDTSEQDSRLDTDVIFVKEERVSPNEVRGPSTTGGGSASRTPRANSRQRTEETQESMEI